jgi:hypothetical protein
VEYNSKWVQNEHEAEALADWLMEHWQRSDSKISADIFGNPLIELGDVVSVKWKTIDADYYVVGIVNSYDGALATTLELRKVGQ